MPLVILGIIAIFAAYIFSPSPIATGVYPSGSSADSKWAGSAKPRYPTAADLRDCEKWQAEKHARGDAEERAP